MAREFKRRTQNAKIWAERVARAKAHSGPVELFCRDEGISSASLGYWRRKLRKEVRPMPTTGKPVSSAFVPVKVLNPESTTSNLPLPDPRWVAEVILHLSRSTR